MNILIESEIYKNLQSMFNQDRYWTVLENLINPYDILNICDRINNHQINNIYDFLVIEVEKQIINFEIDENGLFAIINFKDDAIRIIYNNKNNLLRQSMRLYNLFENRIEAENFLKNIMTYKVSELEKQLNEIKLQLENK